MNKTFIVNFVGKASPSTIKHFAAVTHSNDGKWLISKINFIENQVAAVIKINLPEENEDVVKDVIRNNPNLLAHFVDSETASHDEDDIYQLKLDTEDRAGLVNEITSILDGQGAHILDMDCQRISLAGSGVSSSLFTANLTICLPKEISIEDTSKELESLSEDVRVVLITQ